MGCFLVPATEAIVTTIAEKAVKAKEEKKSEHTDMSVAADVQEASVPMSRKLGWLNKMLWGGSALLAFEHIWHGEVLPFFPFLTAMENPDDAIAMLHEMSTVGVSMAALVTVVWGIMVAVSASARKRTIQEAMPEAEKIPVRVTED